MTHEHLTLTEAIAYSVSMNENGESEIPRQTGRRQAGRGKEKREAIEKSLGQQPEPDVEQAAATILDRLIEERRATKGESEEEARRAIQEELNAQTVEPEETPLPQAGAGGEEPPEGPEPPPTAGGEGGEPPEGPPETPTAGTPEEPKGGEEGGVPPAAAGGGGEGRKSLREEMTEKLEELKSVFEKPEIKAELLKDNPDFSKPEMQDLKNVLDNEVYPVRGLLTELADHVAKLRTEDSITPEGRPLERQISKNSKELLFEWLVERIISIPDKGSPDAAYSIGGFQMQGDLDELTNLAQTYFEPEFIRYIRELIHVRHMAHDLNRSFKFGESYKKYIVEELSASGLSFIQNEIIGIDSVIRLYEKIATQKIAETKTWFSAEDVHDIDEQVRRLFEDLCDAGPIRKEGRKLTDWETRRSLRLGKVLFSGTQRFAMYSVQGNLPEDWSERIGSIPLEFIARNLTPLKIIGARFFGDPGQLQFMRYIMEEVEKTGGGAGTKYESLFGLDKRTIMFNHTNVSDPESHSWRAPLLFFGSINIRLGEGDNARIITLKDFLADKATEFGGSTDPVFGGLRFKEGKRKFSEEVEDFVLGQRLDLSILAQYGNFDPSLKAKIWRKIASLKPSTIASLLGEEEMFQTQADKDTWNTLKGKLYLAEELRVQEDRGRYEEKNPRTDPDTGEELGLTSRYLTNEAAKFSGAVLDDDKYQIENYLRGNNSLEGREGELLRKIIDKGYDKSEMLSGAVMPFTYCIDDVHKISWSKSETGEEGSTQEDLIRLLYSDQDNLNKGWTEINGLIESPTGNAGEHFQKFVDGFASVHGREVAQNKAEPFIVAYLKFVSTKEGILWAPGAMTWSRLLRKPTSEIEKYYRSSYMSWDESEKATFLEALAQAKVISDDIAHPKEIRDDSGRIVEKFATHLDFLRKKTKSNRLSLMLRWARVMLMIFGPVAAYEFLKAIAPDEAKRLLG